MFERIVTIAIILLWMGIISVALCWLVWTLISWLITGALHFVFVVL